MMTAIDHPTSSVDGSLAQQEPPTIAVLGASGYLGSAVTAALGAMPVRLRAVARRPSRVPSGGRADVTVIESDVTSRDALREAVRGADAVIHLVARIGGDSSWRVEDDDVLAEQVNVGVMRDLIAILADRKRRKPPPVVVFGGTVLQAGVVGGRPIDGTEPDLPETGYARQKLEAEQELKAATRAGLIRGISLRLPTLFGCSPNAIDADRGVVATMVRRAAAGEPLTIWDGVEVVRDFLAVDDAADAVLAALAQPDALAGRHWPVGSGSSRDLASVFTEVVQLVAARTGRPEVPIRRVPPPAHATQADFRSIRVDAHAYRAVTGWQPRVAFAVALESAVAALVTGLDAAAPPATTAAKGVSV